MGGDSLLKFWWPILCQCDPCLPLDDYPAAPVFFTLSHVPVKVVHMANNLPTAGIFALFTVMECLYDI